MQILGSALSTGGFLDTNLLVSVNLRFESHAQFELPTRTGLLSGGI